MRFTTMVYEIRKPLYMYTNLLGRPRLNLEVSFIFALMMLIFFSQITVIILVSTIYYES